MTTFRSIGLGVTSLTLCGILGAGCGDDGGGGTGDDTEGDTDPSSTSSTTTSTSTTDAATSDASTTTNGSSTTDPSTTTDATDTDPTGEPAGTRFYRIATIEVRDPHAFLGILDVTGTLNGQLQDGLTMDADEPPDGLLDLGFVLTFDPLDQSDGASEAFDFANAACTDPVASTTCSLLPDTTSYATTYTSSTSGTCYEADPANLTDYGDTGPEPTMAPCFATGPIDVEVVAGSFNLPLTDAVVSAQFMGDPATQLIAGNIEGFVTAEDAANTTVTTPVGDRQLDELLDPDGMDLSDTGWVMHLAFTAVPVEYGG